MSNIISIYYYYFSILLSYMYSARLSLQNESKIIKIQLLVVQLFYFKCFYIEYSFRPIRLLHLLRQIFQNFCFFHFTLCYTNFYKRKFYIFRPISQSTLQWYIFYLVLKIFPYLLISLQILLIIYASYFRLNSCKS